MLMFRRMGRDIPKGFPQVARAAVPRIPFPTHAVPAAQRWGSTNAPATTFLHPPRVQEPEVQRVGPFGPVRNLDIKESTVELSVAFGRHRTSIPFKGMEPCIAQETFVAPNATLIGNVELDDESGVWYGTVIRGDENAVHIGMLTNIYENCLVTADCEVSDISIDTDGSGGRVTELPGVTTIGSHVTVGPGCVLRACTVEDNVIIGANSVICEGSLVEAGAVVGPEAGGAASLVPPGRRVPAGQIWEGNPIKYVRDVTPGEVEEMAKIVRLNLGHLHDHESNCYPIGDDYSMLHREGQSAIQEEHQRRPVKRIPAPEGFLTSLKEA